MKSGFERSDNLYWDEERNKYCPDYSKNNWKWTYVYKLENLEIRAIIKKRSISIFSIDYSKFSKWSKKPWEYCIFSKIDANSIESFNEIVDILPKNIQRNIKIQSLLSNVSRRH
jgi:hypothetical protein